MNPILTEPKTEWQRDQTRYRDFLVAFQKYLFSFGESATINLVGIAFPPIAFGEDIAFPEKVHFYNCTFHGDLLVKNVRHRQPLRVQECRFMGEVRIENSVFASMDQLENTFESEVHWSDLTFEGEVYCSYHVCKEKMYMTDVTFRDQADFDSIFLQKGCEIHGIDGLEYLHWGGLLCAYDTDVCQWEDRETYIQNFRKEDDPDILLIELARKVKKRFPEASSRVVTRLIETTNEWSCYFFLEYFAEETNRLLRQKNYREADVQLLFFQKLIAEGNDEVRSILDVAYVENLMWDFDDKQRTEAWKHIPDRIKDRYEKIWRSYARKG